MPAYSFSGTYGDLDTPESVEALSELAPAPVYIQKEVPGYLYGVWVVGTMVAIFLSFFLGSIAYTG